MGLKLKLEWYDKNTELCEGEALSNDFGEDGSIIEALGIPIENNINNGGFDVLPIWVCKLQPLFEHPINIAAFDYQVSFRYRQTW